MNGQGSGIGDQASGSEIAKSQTLVDRFFKFIDHNRYTFIALLLGVAMVCGVACNVITAPSPFTGENVTHEQLAAQAADFIAEQELAEKREAADFEDALAEIQRQTEAKISTLTKQRSLSIETREAFIASTQRKIDGAVETMNSKQTMLVEAVKLFKQIPFVASVPGIDTAIGAALGVFGIGTLADNKRKDRIIVDKKAQRDAMELQLARASVAAPHANGIATSAAA